MRRAILLAAGLLFAGAPAVLGFQHAPLRPLPQSRSRSRPLFVRLRGPAAPPGPGQGPEGGGPVDVVASIQAAENELKGLKMKLKAAVESESYADASECQAMIGGLTGQIEGLKAGAIAAGYKLQTPEESAKEAAVAAEAAAAKLKVIAKLGEQLKQTREADAAGRMGGGLSLSLSRANETEAAADEVWDAAIAQALQPLDAALASSVAVVQQSVTLAAANGLKKIVIGPGWKPQQQMTQQQQMQQQMQQQQMQQQQQQQQQQMQGGNSRPAAREQELEVMVTEKAYLVRASMFTEEESNAYATTFEPATMPYKDVTQVSRVGR